jgi:hypothetical protein
LSLTAAIAVGTCGVQAASIAALAPSATNTDFVNMGISPLAERALWRLPAARSVR